MQNTTKEEKQILKIDQEGNLRPNKGIAIAQKIIIDWEKMKSRKHMPKT